MAERGYIFNKNGWSLYPVEDAKFVEINEKFAVSISRLVLSGKADEAIKLYASKGAVSVRALLEIVHEAVAVINDGGTADSMAALRHAVDEAGPLVWIMPMFDESNRQQGGD